MSVRTPEETARLANGIETMTPEGRALICQAGEGNGPLDVLLFHQGCTVPDSVHLALAADLAEARAEARAEVAALRPKAEAAERREGLWREYLALILADTAGPVQLAASHGWKLSTFAEGVRLRKALGIVGVGEVEPGVPEPAATGPTGGWSFEGIEGTTLVDRGGRLVLSSTPPPATAEEPREVAEPAPAQGQRFVCLKCGWVGQQSDTYTYPAANSARWHMGCQYAVVPIGEAGS